MIALGIGSGRVRKMFTEFFGAGRLVTLIHPTARISRHSQFGPGFQAIPGSMVANDTQIGVLVLLNCHSVMGHDSRFGDFVSISSQVDTTSEIHCKEGVELGVGASVGPGCRIGKWAVISPGATVTKDVPAGMKVAGAPAR